jgi:hypothetical protein
MLASQQLEPGVDEEEQAHERQRAAVTR